MANSVDIPPVPDCFSHLLVDDTLSTNEPGILNITADSNYGPSESDICANRSYSLREAQKIMCNGEPSKIEELAKESLNLHSAEPLQSSSKGSHGKLDTTFRILRKEMKDLRCMDINLFYQLASLHERIQDAKMSFNDRYSETGSEYSMGTASYMGSMSSLNEESDWAEEASTNEDVTLKDTSESENAIDLLKQISNLALRADADF